jgi:hypothetical protein
MGMKERKNELGSRYARLLVIADAGTSDSGHAMWLAVCDCGDRVEVAGVDLRSGHVRSCGCLHQEIAAENMRAVQPLAAAAKKGKRK